MNWTNILQWPTDAFYKLRTAYDRSSFTFVVEIHRFAQAYLLEMLLSRSDLLEMRGKEFGIPAFILPQRVKSWGFGEVFFLANSSGSEWLTWKCHISRNFKGSNKTLFAIAATLEVVFRFLRFFENPQGYSYYVKQLLLVELGLCKDRSDEISVVLSPGAVEWVASLGARGYKYKPVLEAMMAAYKITAGLDDTDFRVELQDPRQILLSVPGSACHLGSDSGRSKNWQEGVVLDPHNVDSPAQLLTLLAGVFQVYLKANQWSQLMRYADQIIPHLKKDTGWEIRGNGLDQDYTSLHHPDGVCCGVEGGIYLDEIREIFGQKF